VGFWHIAASFPEKRTEVPNNVNSKPKKVTIKVTLYSRNEKGVPVAKTKDVKVTQPKTEGQLARSYEKVLNVIEETRFDQKAISKDLAHAALRGGDVHIISGGGKGVPIVTVRVNKGDVAGGISRVVDKMENHLGFDAVDEDDLGEQLAKLAKSAKAND
jgi:hypothetical protein